MQALPNCEPIVHTSARLLMTLLFPMTSNVVGPSPIVTTGEVARRLRFWDIQCSRSVRMSGPHMSAEVFVCRSSAVEFVRTIMTPSRACVVLFMPPISRSQLTIFSRCQHVQDRRLLTTSHTAGRSRSRIWRTHAHPSHSSSASDYLDREARTVWAGWG